MSPNCGWLAVLALSGISVSVDAAEGPATSTDTNVGLA